MKLMYRCVTPRGTVFWVGPEEVDIFRRVGWETRPSTEEQARQYDRMKYNRTLHPQAYSSILSNIKHIAMETPEERLTRALLGIERAVQHGR